MDRRQEKCYLYAELFKIKIEPLIRSETLTLQGPELVSKDD